MCHELKPLERAVLERIRAEGEGFRAEIETLHVEEREFTGVGAFVNFLGGPSADGGRSQWLGLDCIIQVPGVPTGLGAVLLLNDGYPVMLEFYTFGEEAWDGSAPSFAFQTSA